MKLPMARLSIATLSLATLSIGLALSSTLAIGQNSTPVVELGGSSTVVPEAASQPVNNPGDSYYQSQVLREEVRQLRGMVEQLSYELQRVKQRQMDDYLDIDRRLSAAMAGLEAAGQGVAAEGQPVTAIPGEQSLDSAQPGVVLPEPTVETEVVQQPAYNSEEIAANYAQASNLLLKERNFKGAVTAFKQHIVDYPDSPYLANAYYWLGEIYLLEGQDELARQAFTMVVEQHPNHGKALDANFKLGKIYHQLGELERARALLETAAKGAGGASNKAKSYLQNNF